MEKKLAAQPDFAVQAARCKRSATEIRRLLMLDEVEIAIKLLRGLERNLSKLATDAEIVKDLQKQKLLVCNHNDCEGKGLNAWPGGSRAHLLCTEHKMEGMLSLEHVIPQCAQFGCSKEGTNGFLSHPNCSHCTQTKSTQKPFWCNKHKAPGAVSFYWEKDKMCATVGCLNPANYISSAENRKFCKFCKLDDSTPVDISTGRRKIRKGCWHPNCMKDPSFNYPGKSGRRYCAKHKLEGMVNLQMKRCEQEGCEKACVFNNPGEKRGRFCAAHKLEGMVQVSSYIQCSREHCTKHANFNFEGEKRPRFCASHKLDGMLPVKMAQCAEPDCKKHANAHYPGNSRPLYCSQHKLDGMVNVTHKRCLQAGCTYIPSYNFPGVKARKYCSKHKLEGMVQAFKSSKKLCAGPGCEKQANYNYPGHTSRFCAGHKVQGMVNVNVWKRSMLKKASLPPAPPPLLAHPPPQGGLPPGLGGQLGQVAHLGGMLWPVA